MGVSRGFGGHHENFFPRWIGDQYLHLMRILKLFLDLMLKEDRIKKLG